jgi:predicted RNase H-like HicB family nuclease
VGDLVAGRLVAVQLDARAWVGFESHPCRRSRYAARMAEPTTLHLTAAVTHEGDWYVARCLEIEATSQGETVEQALDNLRDVVEAYLEEEPAPATPRPPLVTSFDVRVPA